MRDVCRDVLFHFTMQELCVVRGVSKAWRQLVVDEWEAIRAYFVEIGSADTATGLNLNELCAVARRAEFNDTIRRLGCDAGANDEAVALARCHADEAPLAGAGCQGRKARGCPRVAACGAVLTHGCADVRRLAGLSALARVSRHIQHGRSVC